jgi:hypothetical protein
MSTSTHNQASPSTTPRESAAARLVVRAVATVGLAAGVVVYLAVAPLIALGTGILGLAAEIRDGVVRPRRLIGAEHGFPFLDPVQIASGGADPPREGAEASE